MAVTILSGDTENYRNIVSDLTGFLPSAFRGAAKDLVPLGAKTERCKINTAREITYKGHPQKFFMGTISAGCCLQGTAAARAALVNQLKARGYNLIRLTHIDQANSGGILKEILPTNWYEIDATKLGYLTETLKLIRAAGMWYCLDFNSFAGNTVGSAIEGADAAAMHALATSIQNFRMLPPINSAADTQFKAYASQLLAIDLGGGVTVANDPNFLVSTITNEHLPDYELDTDTQRVFDAWKGSAWVWTSASDRTLYANACVAYVPSFKAWLAAQGCTAFVTWGSEFGTNLDEYDAVKAAVDIRHAHLYCPVIGTVAPSVLIATEPQKQMTSITNLKLTNSAHELPGGVGPYILEEFTSADPNRFKAEAMHFAAIFCASQEWAGMGQFNWGDGNWTATTPPVPSEYMVCGDRCRDISEFLAQMIFQRGDLLPEARWTATNRAYENRTLWYFGVDTERTISFTGPNGQGSGTLQRGQSFSVTSGERATCFVTAVDPTKPIWEAKRLLIGHLTDIQRVNRVFSDDYTSMTNTGNGATCVRKGTANITFYSAFPNNWTIYRVLPDGTRGATVTPSVAGNLVTVAADNSATPTLLYEGVVTGVPA